MAEEPQVISCHSVEVFREQLAKAKQENKTVVVDFTAIWCPPCRMMAPIFGGLPKRFPHAVFLKVDVDELKPVAEEWNVEAMPTFIFIREEEEVHRIVGARKDEFEEKLAVHCVAPAISGETTSLSSTVTT